MLTLRTDRLTVYIAEPEEKPNTKTRFSRAAFITDVILDGDMHFCASEPRNLIHPTSGGAGFCSEIRSDVSADAGIGDLFPKFGVGLIRKEAEENFSFFKTYKEVHDFPVEYRQDGNVVSFHTPAVECLGYALEEKRKVTVNGNELIVETALTNCGHKAISLDEFCHNFISIDGMAVGSDYHLELPNCPDLGYKRIDNRRGFSGVFRGEGKGVTFSEFTAIDTDMSIDVSTISQEIPFRWRIRHDGAGAYVEGEDYFVPGMIAIWGVDHMLCPEIINRMTLLPGETRKWKRVLHFDKI